MRLGLYPSRTLLARTQQEVVLDKPSVPTYTLSAMGTATMEGTLYLVPVGRVEGAIVNHLCRGDGEAFGTPSQATPALPHPSHAYSLERDQYLATSILEQLTQVDPQNAFRILGVVDLDLHAPQLNFVIGKTAIGGREALVALPRLRQSFYGMPEDLELFRQRTLKEAIHELGHTFCLGHCPKRNYVMCFSNSPPDTDTKGTSFCPGCACSLGEQG